MRKWLVPALAIALLACGKGEQAQEPPKPPTLQNREAFIAERDALGAQLMPPGDSVTISVYVLIDSIGMVHQPEIKQDVDPRLRDAAIALVRKMRFNPAVADGKPKAVLLTIPVRFRNAGQ
jgi:hypothetical protein